ncbi:MAG: hypothetical protein WA655_09845 [Candidatus Korobacteraceae bacterium]
MNAATEFRKSVASRKVAIAILIAGLVVLSLPTICAAQDAGQVKFVNSCKYSLTFNSTGPQIGTLAPGGSKSIPISSFNQGGQNRFIPYPNLQDNQCPNCDGWTDLGGAPGTTQREGWMWEGNDAKYAAYCNPSLSGRGICAQQHNCCGKGMVQDGTFGTHFEFTPNAGGVDFVNLSTNYGSGPHSPPKLCGSAGANPDDCVDKAAVIFYNVPIEWTTNQNCNFTTKGTQVKGGKCFAASCPDAYQHPTDDKQVGCPVSTNRGYVVTFCPAGSSMPNPK